MDSVCWYFILNFCACCLWEIFAYNFSFSCCLSQVLLLGFSWPLKTSWGVSLFVVCLYLTVTVSFLNVWFTFFITTKPCEFLWYEILLFSLSSAHHSEVAFSLLMKCWNMFGFRPGWQVLFLTPKFGKCLHFGKYHHEWWKDDPKTFYSVSTVNIGWCSLKPKSARLTVIYKFTFFRDFSRKM